MPKLTIDGVEVEVEPGTSVLQAAEALGVEIPRFCFHDRLSVAGNCRMCLVEISPGPPKPVASCCLPAADGMVVKTDSPMVREARAGVMEFLLMNHPLDCPICDQGGECDLQDQAVGYGAGRSRYTENKRAVAEKALGPLIKTAMTRCINCTRCVRFAEEIAGAPVLGQFHRGEDAEIGTFIKAAVATEMSGNMIDICPVGALTSRPYAYRARPWELTKTPSIDVHDALGANIRVDSRGREVLRILPRLHEGINEEWIDDRTRFACDGLAERRLDRPWVRGADGRLRETSWATALTAAARGLAGRDVAALAGDLADVEAVVALRDLMDELGSPHRDCRVDGAVFDTSQRSGWLMNAGVAGVDEADILLLVATDPRREATVLGARIFRNWRERGLPIAVIGPAIDAPYGYDHLGDGPDALDRLARARTGFAKTIKGAQNPMILAGMSAFRRPDGLAVHRALHEAAQKFGATFNMLHTAAGRVGALEVGFVPGPGGMDCAGILRDAKALISLGAEVSAPKGCFTVYIGHHGDVGAAGADVVLPGSAYTEKDATYVNTEGRPQRAVRAVAPPGLAREDWTIVRDLAAALGKPLSYNDISARIEAAWPHLARWDTVEPAPWGPFGTAGPVDRVPFAAPKDAYYHANAICRASPTMARCVVAFRAPNSEEAA
ncbi:MAG TPA: NADH-quinone oxidoreductase subunit G [Rhodospirillaceae bacterium]|jgi:NADH-quinone oxidoreductase subunit G|nr:NADH-quinone oxidoreductase subunit G [Alphaproteobacteria bacterium]HBH26312.1 NADH-quinone oxidoreductase subunit G [Rhodospirillaceae bacterium]